MLVKAMRAQRDPGVVLGGVEVDGGSHRAPVCMHELLDWIGRIGSRRWRPAGSVLNSAPVSWASPAALLPARSIHRALGHLQTACAPEHSRSIRMLWKD